MAHSGIFRLKFFRRLSLSFVFLVSIVALSISAFLFVAFRSTAQDEIARSSVQMLKQTAFLCSTFITQVLNAGDSLANSGPLRELANGADSKRTNEVILTLNTYRDLNPLIDSLSVSFSGGDVSIHTDQSVPPGTAGFEAELFAAPAATWPLQIAWQFVTPVGDQKNLISFVWPVGMASGDSEPSSFLSIHVSESAIGTLLNMSSNVNDEELLILDSRNRIIATNAARTFLESAGGESFVTRILFSDTESGSFEGTYLNNPSLVSYTPILAPSWRLVGTRPLVSIVPNLAHLGAWVTVVVVAILTAGSVLALFAAQSLYMPIFSVLDRDFRLFTRPNENVDELNVFAAAMSQVRAYCFRHLLLESEPEEAMAAAMFESFKLSRGRGISCVAVIQFSELKNESIAVETLVQLRSGLEETVRTLFPFSMQVEMYHADDRETVLLTALENSAQVDEVLYALRWLQASFRAQFGYGIAAGVGSPVEDLSGVASSYRSAKRAVELRFRKGSESISSYLEIDAESDYRGYPTGLESRIIGALTLNRVDDLEKFEHQFLVHLNVLSTDVLIYHASEMVVAIKRHFEPIIGKNPDWHVPEIWHLTNFRELEIALHRFYYETFEALLAKNSRKSEELVEKMKLFIQRNYRDPALNLGMAAASVHLSREYAGRLFRNTTGVSVAQFLNNFRMERAKELLETTNQSVSVIAEKIGLSNVTYLFTLFKKTYSMTPTQFREEL